MVVINLVAVKSIDSSSTTTMTQTIELCQHLAP